MAIAVVLLCNDRSTVAVHKQSICEKRLASDAGEELAQGSDIRAPGTIAA